MATSGARTGEAALSIRNLSKTFFGVIAALRDVSLTFEEGKIHALLGQNGAGKSTLVKILSGYHSPDNGASIKLWGQPVKFTAHDGPRQGIGIVHQDMPFDDRLPIVDNLGVGAHFGSLPLGVINWRREEREVAALLDEFGVRVDPRALMSSVTPAERSLLNVIRTIRGIRQFGHEQFVLVLDEPTSYLAQADAQRLLEEVRKLADRGCAVVLITHRLGEALEWADQISVLRSGRLVGSHPVYDLDESSVEALMFGAAPSAAPVWTDATSGSRGTPVLEARALSGARVQSLDFSMWPGVVTGVSGLAGMGQDELPYLLYGTTRNSAGDMYLDGNRWRPSPSDSIRRGVMLVPGNRRASLWAAGSLLENLTITELASTKHSFVIKRREERRRGQQVLSAFGVRPDDPRAQIHMLSGGNQQKVALARVLDHNPKVLLLHEPTQGVDAAASREILDLAKKAAQAGAAVGIFSSDAAELAHACSEVSILSDGKVVSVLRGDQVTDAGITAATQRGRSVTTGA